MALEATLAEKKARLEAARDDASEADLEARIRDSAGKQQALEAGVADIHKQLEALAPDTVETLYTNATESLERAKKELASADQDLAVLDDRLAQAQADGRFEALEAAQRRTVEFERELDATRRRAAAAERLWQTMNAHRDAARQAYVRPLKEAIERLGQIVFGPSFAIEISDDWTLESRVLDGTRLPGTACNRGSRRPVSAKWPRWLVPNCNSKPSAVSWRWGGFNTPALLIKRSSRLWRPVSTG